MQYVMKLRHMKLHRMILCNPSSVFWVYSGPSYQTSTIVGVRALISCKKLRPKVNFTNVKESELHNIFKLKLILKMFATFW